MRMLKASGRGASGSLWSLWSEGSVLSIASKGSVLSIGSVGSALSIGSVGSFLSVLSVGFCGIYWFSAFGRVTVVGHVLPLRQSGPEWAFATRLLTSAAHSRLTSAAA